MVGQSHTFNFAGTKRKIVNILIQDDVLLRQVKTKLIMTLTVRKDEKILF
jgi:hypothetical protein